MLCNLGAWSDWGTLYAPVLGPLPAFLSKHQQLLGFRVLEVPGSSLLKLPGVGSSDKQLDLQQLRDGLKQAGEQVGVCGACGGRGSEAAQAPLVLFLVRMANTLLE